MISIHPYTINFIVRSCLVFLISIGDIFNKFLHPTNKASLYTVGEWRLSKFSLPPQASKSQGKSFHLHGSINPMRAAVRVRCPRLVPAKSLRSPPQKQYFTALASPARLFGKSTETHSSMPPSTGHRRSSAAAGGHTATAADRNSPSKPCGLHY